jgi:hypothetical protein
MKTSCKKKWSFFRLWWKTYKISFSSFLTLKRSIFERFFGFMLNWCRLSKKPKIKLKYSFSVFFRCFFCFYQIGGKSHFHAHFSQKTVIFCCKVTLEVTQSSYFTISYPNAAIEHAYSARIGSEPGNLSPVGAEKTAGLLESVNFFLYFFQNFHFFES